MHLRLAHDDDQCECLEIDYGFLGDPEAAATEMPILVGRTRINKAIWASPVPHKGVVDSPHGTNRLMSWLDETGLRKIIIKSATGNKNEHLARKILSAVVTRDIICNFARYTVGDVHSRAPMPYWCCQSHASSRFVYSNGKLSFRPVAPLSNTSASTL